MSEEIQEKHERQQQQQHSELEQKEEEGSKSSSTKLDPDPGGGQPPSSLGRAAPRSGALLVEIYGRVVRKQYNSFSPNQVYLDFTKYLVSFRIQ